MWLLRPPRVVIFLCFESSLLCRGDCRGVWFGGDCNLPYVCCYPSCVEVIVEVVLVSFLCRGDCGGVFELVGIPLSVEVDLVWLTALSL